MSYLVVVVGWNANNLLSSGSIGASGVTVLSCPSCPKTPNAVNGSGVSAPIADPTELRVLHFNTRAGAIAWRINHASELQDKVLLMDGDDGGD